MTNEDKLILAFLKMDKDERKEMILAARRRKIRMSIDGQRVVIWVHNGVFMNASRIGRMWQLRDRSENQRVTMTITQQALVEKIAESLGDYVFI